MPFDVIKTYMQTHGAEVAAAGMRGQAAAFWATGKHHSSGSTWRLAEKTRTWVRNTVYSVCLRCSGTALIGQGCTCCQLQTLGFLIRCYALHACQAQPFYSAAPKHQPALTLHSMQQGTTNAVWFESSLCGCMSTCRQQDGGSRWPRRAVCWPGATAGAAGA